MRVRTEERREAIIRTAGEVFCELGYHGATMSEVSARLGGSKATLYSYFDSKEALLFAVLEAEAGAEIRAAFGAMDASGPAREVLRTFARAYVRFICSDKILAIRRMIIAEGGRSEVGRLLHARKAPELARVTARMATAMETRELAAGDPLKATEHLLTLVTSFRYFQVLEGVIEAPSPEKSDAWADEAVEIFLRAYSPEG